MKLRLTTQLPRIPTDSVCQRTHRSTTHWKTCRLVLTRRQTCLPSAERGPGISFAPSHGRLLSRNWEVFAVREPKGATPQNPSSVPFSFHQCRHHRQLVIRNFYRFYGILPFQRPEPGTEDSQLFSGEPSFFDKELQRPHPSGPHQKQHQEQTKNNSSCVLFCVFFLLFSLVFPLKFLWFSLVFFVFPCFFFVFDCSSCFPCLSWFFFCFSFP